MHVITRPARDQADSDFIRLLDERLVRVFRAPAHSPQEVAAFQARFTAAALTTTDTACTIIALTEDGRRLGYINARMTIDEISLEPSAYIALLAVAREAEGHGVAQALMKDAEAWARGEGATRFFLDVIAGNERGRAFYARAGFAEESLRLVKRLD